MQKYVWLIGALSIIWLSHLIGVFTPEVGFDAVWYHLPVIKVVAEQGGLVYLPEIYQSVNPLFSDLIFGIGYVISGEHGAKVVAYIFGLSLSAMTYKLSRCVMNVKWSLVTTLIVSTFQVVAWQSSSFYVDVAKAFWEICMLWSLLEWQRTKKISYVVIAGFLLGASLGTKLFSLILLPVALAHIFQVKTKHTIRDAVTFVGTALIIPLPFFIFSYINTGSPWYSFDQHLEKISEIGVGHTLIEQIIARTTQLPSIGMELLFARDYTSIVLILFLPLTIWSSRAFWSDRKLMLMTMWTIAQIVVWWYLPPLSTRYALSGFITWTVITMWAVRRYVEDNKRAELPMWMTICLAIAINMAPRLYVNYRSLQYIVGKQSKTEYIEQFYDGNIDQHLKKWHLLS
jgi:hypothetical protein